MSTKFKFCADFRPRYDEAEADDGDDETCEEACITPVCLPVARMSSALRFIGAKPNQVGVYRLRRKGTWTEFITIVKIATFNGLEPKLI